MNKNDITSHEIKDLFDQTLGQHIERLIGTRYGIGALPLNLETISCLILLTERENEIESFPSDPLERYTHETFLDELAKIGFNSDEDLKTTLQKMIQEGYIDVDGDGRFSPNRPTLSMVQLIERVLPGIPGMNLVAYFVQTIDEVQSGRKGLESAISQFDQMLQMQGVPLKKEKVSEPPLRTKPQIPRKEEPIRPDISRRIQAEVRPEDSHVIPSESKVISSDRISGQHEIRAVGIEEFLAGQEESPELPPEMDEAIEAQEPDITEDERGPEEVETAPEVLSPTEPEVSTEVISDISSAPAAETEDLAERPVEREAGLSERAEIEWEESKPIEREEPVPPAETTVGAEIVSEEQAPDGADDAIARRISTFEEDLALQCPLCRTAKVQLEETALGKHYYKCSNKGCNFISWGKPYHLACPRCNNPFLVETSNREEKMILKCPRATCRHWQPLGWEETDSAQQYVSPRPQDSVKPPVTSRKPRKKRVVKRRVVRRKR